MRTPSFTRDDVEALTAAHDLIEAWRTFLLSRFADYTHHAEVTPVGGAVALDPIADVFARTNHGYGHFTLPSNWYKRLIDALTTTDGAHDAVVTVEHVISNERAPATVRQYRMPLEFVFNDASATNPEYVEFLRLKAQFESSPAAGINVEQRRDAAKDLIAEARDRDIDYTQVMEDPTVAEDMYAKALATASKEIDGAQGDRIRHIHTLAAKLGLPKRPTNPLNAKRREAARVLATQSRRGTEPEPTRERIEFLALPENSDHALVAYDRAMESLMKPIHGGLGDIRHKVHDAAYTLGLDTSFAARAAARERLGVAAPTS